MKKNSVKTSADSNSETPTHWIHAELHYNRIWDAKTDAKFLTAIHAFLKAAPSPDTPLLQGFTALMMCAMKNNTQAMSALVSAGANIEAKSQSGQTALMLAASCKSQAALTWLLDRGADAKAIDEDGDDVLQRGLFCPVGLLCDLVDAGADPRKECRGVSRQSYINDLGRFEHGDSIDLHGASRFNHKIAALEALAEKISIKEMASTAPLRQTESPTSARKTARL